MDITKFVVSLREGSLLDGDYGVYQRCLSKKLRNSRKKLGIATKNRGKYQAKDVSAEEISGDLEFLRLQILTAERAWASAMAMKTSHAADTKGISGKTRSHIASRIDRAARTIERLFELLSNQASGAGSTDVLEAKAYAAMLRGANLFERQAWERCVRSYAVSRIIYSAMSTSSKGDIFNELLSGTIDPSIRYAAYQMKIPRTEPVPNIARQAFPTSDTELVDRITKLNSEVLEHGDVDVHQAISGSKGAPTTLAWRNRAVKIEDAAIAVAWASVGTAKAKLVEKLSESASLEPKVQAVAYDDILNASQDAVDATKTAIDELRAEGVPQSDSRMQSLQITRTAVNFEMISWRIGRNRVLTGEDDGAKLVPSLPQKKRRAKQDAASVRTKEEAPGRLLTRLKERVVLYDGTLQSIESIMELPGVANDEELSRRLEATTAYFTALKCLAIARSHSIVDNDMNALALTRKASDDCEKALPVLCETEGGFPRNMTVTSDDAQALHKLLIRELQRCRALAEMSMLSKSIKSSRANGASRPLLDRLHEYPRGEVDLENLVPYPPRVEVVPVKPILLDVAWNYIDYPDKTAKPTARASAAQAQEDAKPQKRGWFGFGR